MQRTQKLLKNALEFEREEWGRMLRGGELGEVLAGCSLKTLAEPRRNPDLALSHYHIKGLEPRMTALC